MNDTYDTKSILNIGQQSSHSGNMILELKMADLDGFTQKNREIHRNDIGLIKEPVAIMAHSSGQSEVKRTKLVDITQAFNAKAESAQTCTSLEQILNAYQVLDALDRDTLAHFSTLLFQYRKYRLQDLQ